MLRKSIKLVGVVIFLYMISFILKTIIFSYVSHSIHPDFTIDRSLETVKKIETMQLSFPFIFYYFLFEFLFVFISYIYIYIKFKPRKIYIYILPIVMFLCDIYLYVSEDANRSYWASLSASKVYAILCSVAIIYSVDKYHKNKSIKTSLSK